jgi:hypothetical protein
MSIDRIFKLAERFARKISLAQGITGEDPKSVVTDAFLGPHEEIPFQNFILDQNSHFSQALPDSVKTIDIGASVSASKKTATFLVTPKPGTPAIAMKLVAALREDYKAKYGSYPEERFAARLAKGDIKPPNVEASHPAIISIK